MQSPPDSNTVKHMQEFRNVETFSTKMFEKQNFQLFCAGADQLFLFNNHESLIFTRRYAPKARRRESRTHSKKLKTQWAEDKFLSIPYIKHTNTHAWNMFWNQNAKWRLAARPCVTHQLQACLRWAALLLKSWCRRRLRPLCCCSELIPHTRTVKSSNQHSESVCAFLLFTHSLEVFVYRP